MFRKFDTKLDNYNNMVHINSFDFEAYKKTQNDLLKEKYKSGNYIMVRRNDPSFHEYTFNTKSCEKHGFRIIENNWYIIEPEESYKYYDSFEHKLIHKKHEKILDTYIKNDKSIAIEVDMYDDSQYPPEIEENFIENYNEEFDYRLIPLEVNYPIFKRNEYGEVFKIVNDKRKGFNVICMISNDLKRIGFEYGKQFIDENYETIPYDSEQNLYYLQPVWCWDNDVGKSNRMLRFFLEKVFVSFTGDNEIDKFDNIEPVTAKQLKAMPFIWDLYQRILHVNKH